MGERRDARGAQGPVKPEVRVPRPAASDAGGRGAASRDTGPLRATSLDPASLDPASLDAASLGSESPGRASTGEGVGASTVYDIEASDPTGMLLDRSGIDADEIRQITAVMAALGELRDAEQRLAEASRRYMRLNETDMRALLYLIVCANRGAVATPGGIAQHLGISTASTTKLLDRLERGGHVTRAAHPSDRRALAISITPETQRAAMETVGRQQARRFHSAARLSADEREVVIRFLRDMTQELGLDGVDWANAEPER